MKMPPAATTPPGSQRTGGWNWSSRRRTAGRRVPLADDYRRRERSRSAPPEHRADEQRSRRLARQHHGAVALPRHSLHKHRGGGARGHRARVLTFGQYAFDIGIEENPLGLDVPRAFDAFRLLFAADVAPAARTRVV